MTTTLMPPESAAAGGQAHRILSIGANLLPPEIMAARRTRKVRRYVLSALVVFVALVAVWYSLAAMQTSAAQDDLKAAETTAHDLERQQRSFTDLVGVQAESEAIDAQLTALLARDLQWADLLQSVQKTTPSGVLLTSISGSLTALPQGATDSTTEDANAVGGTARLPNTSGQRLVGEITVAGTAPSEAVVADYVDALAKLKGLGNPLLGNVTVDNSRAEFTVRLDITGAALGGRYSPKLAAPAKTGGK